MSSRRCNSMDLLKLVGRDREILQEDFAIHNTSLTAEVQKSRFLVIGGAGSIGQAVVKELFARNPQTLYVVDISENNLVELVRDLRSSIGYIAGDFQVFALDAGSEHFFKWLENCEQFDYVLNLSALKHVRSEKDAYTLMRLIDVNIINVKSCLDILQDKGCKKYFAVSTDKAANPANLMGASKFLMERYLLNNSDKIEFSSARFANVAFSDGSLLHGFDQRILKRQPLSAPNDVRRYFITPKEAGRICLLSCIQGGNRDIYFPKLSKKLHEITFAEIAIRYLEAKDKVAYICKSENEAREYLSLNQDLKNWPCYFFKTDTTGEKDFEEFFTKNEKLQMEKYVDLGVIKNTVSKYDNCVDVFLTQIYEMRKSKSYSREDLTLLFTNVINQLEYKDTGKFLDGKM